MKVGFDTLGKYDIGFPLPRAAPKIFTLCTAFLKKEDTLSASARTVYTEDIRALYTTVADLLDLKSGGESQRTLSSEEVKALDKQSVALIKKIHRTMVYEFAETPAQVTRWGFDISQTGKRAGTILMPDGRAAIVKTLAQYAKTERARPATDRFKQPLLADVEKSSRWLASQPGRPADRQNPAHHRHATNTRRRRALARSVAGGSRADRGEAIQRQSRARVGPVGL